MTAEALIVENLGLVHQVANRYRCRGLDREDVVGEGVVGLMRAAEKFDPSRGFKFSTLAVPAIRHAIARAVANTGGTVRIPVSALKLLGDWRRAEKALYLETGRRPGFDEIADRLGLDGEARRRAAQALAASRPVMGGESVEIEGEPGPVEDDNPDGGRAELLRRLEGLSDLHRAVLTLRFGLGGEGPLKLREVADRLGCSRQNVHQLEAQALRRLGLEKAGGPKSMTFRPAAGRGR